MNYNVYLPFVSAAIAFGIALPYYSVPAALLLGLFSGTVYVVVSKYVWRTL